MKMNPFFLRLDRYVWVYCPCSWTFYSRFMTGSRAMPLPRASVIYLSFLHRFLSFLYIARVCERLKRCWSMADGFHEPRYLHLSSSDESQEKKRREK